MKPYRPVISPAVQCVLVRGRRQSRHAMYITAVLQLHMTNMSCAGNGNVNGVGSANVQGYLNSLGSNIVRFTIAPPHAFERHDQGCAL